jgi:murein DD-endopeptidase MepM/ murein hydrolase activator NlpD
MSYFPVIDFPNTPPVFDLSVADIDTAGSGQEWGIGKYNEKRLNVYKQFYHGNRDIHMGVDLFCPKGTPVHAFTDGELYLFANNATPGDYGYTLIYTHVLENGETVYALYGHLGAKSVEGKLIGLKVAAGEVIGWAGDRTENGGWPPHVHFQLSTTAPEVCDMPGAVADDQLEAALQKYPDPRIVLGAIF